MVEQKHLSSDEIKIIENKTQSFFDNYKGLELYKKLTFLVEINNCYYHIIHEKILTLLDSEKKKKRQKEMIDSLIYLLRFILLSKQFNECQIDGETINTKLFFQFKYNEKLNQYIKDLNKEDALLNEVVCIYKYHTMNSEIKDISSFTQSLLVYYESYFPLFENFNKKRLCSSWNYSFEQNTVDQKMLYKSYPESFILYHFFIIQEVVINYYHEKFLHYLENKINYEITDDLGEIIFMFSQKNKESQYLELLEKNNLSHFMKLLPSLVETYGTIYNPNLPILMKNINLLQDSDAKLFFQNNLFIDFFHYFASEKDFDFKNKDMIQKNVKYGLEHGFFDIFNKNKIAYFESLKDLEEFEIVDGSTFANEYGFSEAMQLVSHVYENKREFSLIDLLSIIDGFNFPQIEELFTTLNIIQYKLFIKVLKDNFEKIKLLNYDKKYHYKNTVLILEKESFNSLLIDESLSKVVKKL
jgi:hypothetical protein